MTNRSSTGWYAYQYNILIVSSTMKESFFVDATILSVAHRLDTIMDYDKVLVLGEGKVLEYGSPWWIVREKQWQSF
jgi:ABC-type multidrug transport system fused ATPase/permease subunit